MGRENYAASARKSSVNSDKGMGTINPDTAGIDVGSEFHYVSVPPGRAEDDVRRFGVYTCDLREISKWLKACGVKSVAMESTGVYWIPLYQVLAKDGFEVLLVNARHLRGVPGRPKTDVLDCQWIRRLHSCGLLNGSFRPSGEICEIRSLQRHREGLVESASRHVQHMQKSLQQMNVRLDEAVSDITGKTGLAIIEAVLAGERNPRRLAALRDVRVKADEKEVARALCGDYRAEHVFVLRQSYGCYKFLLAQMEECDAEIRGRLDELEKKVDAGATPPPPPSGGSRRSNRSQPSVDVRTHLYEAFGTDVTQAPGIKSATALTLLSEVGRDLSPWPTERHFTSWLGLCPAREISGGKVLKNSTRKVAGRASDAFRMAASSLKHSDCHLGDFYRRIRARAGAPKAVTATARKLAVVFYHMVRDGKPYKEPDMNRLKMERTRRLVENLKRSVGRIGFKLVPATAEA